MNITALIPLSFRHFFSLKFHLVYPFIAALCRLQLELGKALCSIAVIIIIIIIIITSHFKKLSTEHFFSESQLFDFKLLSNRRTFSILDDRNESRTGQVLKQNLVSVWDDFFLTKKIKPALQPKSWAKDCFALGHFVNLQFRRLAILTTQTKLFSMRTKFWAKYTIGWCFA